MAQTPPPHTDNSSCLSVRRRLGEDNDYHAAAALAYSVRKSAENYNK